MPAYLYICHSCDKTWTEMHGFGEEVNICPFCSSKTASRTFDRSGTISLLKEELPAFKEKKKIGAKTREHIEQARQELKEFKTEQKK